MYMFHFHEGTLLEGTNVIGLVYIYIYHSTGIGMRNVKGIEISAGYIHVECSSSTTA